MTERKWFLLADGQVTGPYQKDEASEKAKTLSSPLIWARGSSEWVSAHKLSQLDQEINSLETKAKSSPERIWKVKVANGEPRPLGHSQMLDYLKTLPDLSEVQIWTEGYNEWKDVFQIHKLMDELGVSRRKHPRVPIMGTLLCEGTTGSFNARALSISEGGLGITDCPDVKIGEKFKTILKSPNLYGPIHSTAEVVYVGADHYAGLKFIGLPSESKSAIIEYVKKFIDLKPTH